MRSETVGQTKVTNVGATFFTRVGKKMKIEVGEELEIIVGKYGHEKHGTIIFRCVHFNSTASGPVQINGEVVDLNKPGGDSSVA